MLLVVFIIGIAVLGIVAQSSSAVRGTRVAEQGAESMSLAQAKIEELRGARFADVSSGQDTSTLGSGATSGGIFARSWNVSAKTINGVPAKEVAVTVAWPEAGGTPSVTLSTLIVDVPAYGPGFPSVIQRTWRRG